MLVDDTVPVAGEEVARDETKGMRVIRAEQPVRVAYVTDGVYDDGWSSERFAYRRFGCDGGTLVARLAQDPKLVSVPQRVTATAGSRTVSTRVSGTDETLLAVPLTAVDGRCDVRFEVAPSAVPGDGDTRRLGVRVNGFRYRP